MVTSSLLSAAVLVGSLLGLTSSPLLSSSSSSSLVTSDGTTTTIVPTGETYNPLETPLYVGDNGQKRATEIRLNNLYDTFNFLDRLQVNHDSYATQIVATLPYSNISGSVNGYEEIVYRSSNGISDCLKGLVTEADSLYDEPELTYYKFNPELTDYFNLTATYNIKMKVNNLTYSQSTVDTFLKFYLLENLHYGPVTGYGGESFHQGLNLVSVCLPEVNVIVPIDDSNDLLEFEIIIRPSSYRLIYDYDNALISRLANYQSSSLSIFPYQAVSEGQYGFVSAPSFYRNYFINNTGGPLLCGVTTYTATSNGVIGSPAFEYGIKLASGYKGPSPYYLSTYTSEEEYCGWVRSWSAPDGLLSFNYVNGEGGTSRYQVDCNASNTLVFPVAWDGTPALEGNCIYLINCGEDDNIPAYYNMIISLGEKPVIVNYNIIPLDSLIWQILTIPFAFMSQAFDVTIFAGTPYAFNIGNILLGFVSLVVIVGLIMFVLKFVKGGK